jgi:hypothetical protein
MRTLTIVLQDNGELAILVDSICERAAQLEDDGREGNPDAVVLWKVVKQLRKQYQIGGEMYHVQKSQ